MSYQRIATPRIYPCAINHALSLGKMTTANFKHYIGGAEQTSDNKSELFNLKPAQAVNLGGNNTTSEHIIQIDSNEASDTFMSDNNFMLIMGHNFHNADVKFRVYNYDTWGETVKTLTPIVNAGSLTGSGGTWTSPQSGNYQAWYNNWTLFSFTGGSTTNQYTRLYLNYNDDDHGASGSVRTPDGSYAQDIKIANIIMGDYWDFPHAPDMRIKKSIEFGNTVQESVGGSTYSNASWLAAPHWGGSFEAFDAKTHTTPNQMRKAGKVTYDMNFSYMTDSDLFTSELYQEQDIFTETSFMGQVLQRTLGTHHPFLIQWDNSSSALVRDNFSWVRFVGVPTFTQVAHRTWNVNVSLVEEF